MSANNFGYMPDEHVEITIRIHLPQTPDKPHAGQSLNFIAELAATLNQGIDNPDEWAVVELLDGKHAGFAANGSGSQPLHLTVSGWGAGKERLAW